MRPLLVEASLQGIDYLDERERQFASHDHKELLRSLVQKRKELLRTPKEHDVTVLLMWVLAFVLGLHSIKRQAKDNTNYYFQQTFYFLVKGTLDQHVADTLYHTWCNWKAVLLWEKSQVVWSSLNKKTNKKNCSTQNKNLKSGVSRWHIKEIVLLIRKSILISKNDELSALTAPIEICPLNTL